MIARILQHVNGRTDSGRVFSAMEGTVSVIDDNDAELVALFEMFESRGMVAIERDDEEAEEPVDPDVKAAIVDADGDDTKTAIVKPTKRTRGSAERT